MVWIKVNLRMKIVFGLKDGKMFNRFGFIVIQFCNEGKEKIFWMKNVIVYFFLMVF